MIGGLVSFVIFVIDWVWFLDVVRCKLILEIGGIVLVLKLKVMWV